MSTSPAGDSRQVRFVLVLPRIQLHARVYFRHVRCPHKKDDYQAETVALCWKWFVRLEERGKAPCEFVSVLASFATRAVRSGRRLVGSEKAGDVLSPVAQQKHSFVVQSLPTSTRASYEHLYAEPQGQRHLDAYEEMLRDNRRTAVPEQVQFRLDFPAWLATLSERDRRVIAFMARGEKTTHLARQFGLSAGRISQLRRQFLEGWKRFIGDDVIALRQPLRRRKKRLRT
jgi:hypothetical protein